jgi:carboxylesterase type B
MVHGGAYFKGSSDSKLFAPDYLMDQEVVLVTMNYRLGALGMRKKFASFDVYSRND